VTERFYTGRMDGQPGGNIRLTTEMHIDTQAESMSLSHTHTHTHTHTHVSQVSVSQTTVVLDHQTFLRA